MITVIAEHSVDLSLLPDKANILDLGCRGFLFSSHLMSLGHTVHRVDCDSLEGDYTYFKLAITDYNGYIGVVKSNDPQGTKVENHRKAARLPGDVKCYTLKSFCDLVRVPFFDLIKMDVEGSEREIIMSMGKPYAKQLSIEFHLHTGIYGDAQVKEMEDKLLSLGYFPVKHDKTKQHGLGFNWWDSLWILQK